MPETVLRFNVKDPAFGAFGDGVRDDTAAIQKVVNHLNNVGAKGSASVFFPAGTYLINSATGVTLSTSGITFEGVGPTNSVIVVGAETPTATRVAFTVPQDFSCRFEYIGFQGPTDANGQTITAIDASAAPTAGTDPVITLDECTTSNSAAISLATGVTLRRIPIVQDIPGSGTVDLGSNPTLENDTISVKTFGALGDNSTDDLAAINAAITAGAASGKRIFFPAGTYRISDTISITSADVWLDGVGDQTVIKPTDDSGSSCNPIINIKGTFRARVTNMKLDGNATNLSQLSAHAALRIAGSSECWIDHVKIVDTGNTTAAPGGAHIVVNAYETGDSDAGGNDSPGDASLSNKITNCYLDDSGHICSFGIQLVTNWLNDIAESSFTQYVSHTEVTGNYLEGFTFNALSLEGPATYYNSITDNVVFEHNGNTAFDNDKGASYNVWKGNHAYDFLIANTNDNDPNTPSAGFRVQGYTLTVNQRTARGVVVEGNIIQNLGAAVNASQGVRLGIQCDGVVVSNNYLDVDCTAANSIGVEIFEICNNVVISNNYITNSDQGITNNPTSLSANMTGATIDGNMIDGSTYGIRVRNADSGGFTWERVNITNNSIRGSASIGIWWGKDVEFGVISGNVIQNTGASSMQLEGLSCNVVGNIMADASSRGIYVVANAANLRIIGNVVDSGITDEYRTDIADYNTYLMANSWQESTGPRIMYSTAAPVSGTFAVGDIVYNSAPSAGGTIGWICTTAGTPGTWKTFGSIAA